jgi:UDP-2-acetamido-3-amino-2,3-dideoxy-glucuronate N-acetyltransferase
MADKSVAVVGCGYWGKNLVRNFHELGALKIVCDPDAGNLERARSVAPKVRQTANFEAVLNDPEIDGIALATPAVTHRDMAIQALESGKDVMVEKPMALSTAQGLEMIEAAERTQRILMVGHLLEYHPAIVTLRQLIQNGVLGRLRYVYSNRLNFGKIRREENALWSFAPHDVAVLLRLVGSSPERVSCQAATYLNAEVADVTMSNLDFPDNIHGHIFVSWLNPFKEQRLVVIGDEKMAVFNDVLKERKLVLYDQHVRVTESADILHKKAEIPVEIPSAEPLREECREFLSCMTSRNPPLTDGRSGLEVLKVLEACQWSIQKNGLPVSPGQDPTH